MSKFPLKFVLGNIAQMLTQEIAKPVARRAGTAVGSMGATSIVAADHAITFEAALTVVIGVLVDLIVRKTIKALQ